MATDGGQIRTVDKVLAEQNHSHTCTTTSIMVSDKCIIGNGARTLAPKTIDKKGILIVDASGNAHHFPVLDGEAGYNKILAIDEQGNLTWKDQQGGA
jgi:hypothetical protein